MSTYERYSYLEETYPKKFNRSYEYEEIWKQYSAYGNVTNLMKYFTVDKLLEAYKSLENKAPGTDGIDKYTYTKYPWWVVKKGLQMKYDQEHPHKFEETILYENIEHIANCIKSGSYEFKPTRRIYIDKPGSLEKRPLSIPCIEDKIVEKVMADILMEVYDSLLGRSIFLSNSYGFREYRNADMALRRVYNDITRKGLYSVICLDISKFFDRIDRNLLMELLRRVIKDKRFLDLIERSLYRGYRERGDTHTRDTGMGIAQGSITGPILANIYRHYMLDSWFEQEVKTNCEYHNVDMLIDDDLVAYADDVLVLLPDSKTATDFLSVLKKRITEFKLEVSEKKTEVVDLKSSLSSNNHFRFLGFQISPVLYDSGNMDLVLITDPKRLEDKEKRIVDTLNKSIIRHIEEPLSNGQSIRLNLIKRDVNRVLKGYYNYYGYDTNIEWLNYIYQFAKEQFAELVFGGLIKEIPIEQVLKLVILNKPKPEKLKSFKDES